MPLLPNGSSAGKAHTAPSTSSSSPPAIGSQRGSCLRIPWRVATPCVSFCS